MKRRRWLWVLGAAVALVVASLAVLLAAIKPTEPERRIDELALREGLTQMPKAQIDEIARVSDYPVRRAYHAKLSDDASDRVSNLYQRLSSDDRYVNELRGLTKGELPQGETLRDWFKFAQMFNPGPGPGVMFVRSDTSDSSGARDVWVIYTTDEPTQVQKLQQWWRRLTTGRAP